MTQANEPITQAGIDTAETIGELIQEMLMVEWSYSDLEDSPSEPYVLDEDGRFAAKIAAELDAQAADAKAWRTLRRYERLLIAGFCSYADLNAAKAEAQQAAQEATS